MFVMRRAATTCRNITNLRAIQVSTFGDQHAGTLRIKFPSCQFFQKEPVGCYRTSKDRLCLDYIILSHIFVIFCTLLAKMMSIILYVFVCYYIVYWNINITQHSSFLLKTEEMCKIYYIYSIWRVYIYYIFHIRSKKIENWFLFELYYLDTRNIDHVIT